MGALGRMREPGKDMANLQSRLDSDGLWPDLRSDDRRVLAIFYDVIASIFFMIASP
jgi:hypothetical protein